MMSAQGRIVRGTPTGPWTSRHHRWEPLEQWWPGGLPELTAEDCQRELARRWLTRFGPATAGDLQWWTGWNQATVRHALRELPVEEVDLHGGTGIALASDDPGDTPTAPPAAALLPALDPTPMGWKRRDWLFGIPQHHVFDNRGNIGPTLWWDGEIIGSWAITPTGEIRTHCSQTAAPPHAPPSRTPQHGWKHGCREPRPPPRSAHPWNASSSRESLRRLQDPDIGWPLILHRTRTNVLHASLDICLLIRQAFLFGDPARAAPLGRHGLSTFLPAVWHEHVPCAQLMAIAGPFVTFAGPRCEPGVAKRVRGGGLRR
jgi:hypothetical protein